MMLYFQFFCFLVSCVGFHWKWSPQRTVMTARVTIQSSSKDSDLPFLFAKDNDNPTQGEVDAYFRRNTNPNREEVISILQRSLKWKKKMAIDVLIGNNLLIVICSLQQMLPRLTKPQRRHATIGMLECLQVISSSDIEKSDILGIAVKLLKSSHDIQIRFTSIDISRMLFGLQNLKSSDNPIVMEILSALLIFLFNSKEKFGVTSLGSSLYGLQGMSSEHDIMRAFLFVFTAKVAESDEKFTAQAIGNTLYGLRSMTSQTPEVRSMLGVLADKFKTCDETLTAQAVSNALFGMQGMSSKHEEVRNVLVVLTDKMKTCKQKFTSQAVGNSLYGMQGMSSAHVEVRNVLVLLTDKVTFCEEKLTAQAISNALYGLRSLSSNHPEVRSLLGVLMEKVIACEEPFTPLAVGNILYGVKGMDVDNKTVRSLLAALKDKVKICLEKNISDQSTSILEYLQRSFLIGRHHMVAMLGSERLLSEYNNKIAAELLQRKEPKDPLIPSAKVDSVDEMLSEFYEGEQQQQQQQQQEDDIPKVVPMNVKRKNVNTIPTTAPLVASRAKAASKDDKLSTTVDDLFSDIYEEEEM